MSGQGCWRGQLPADYSFDDVVDHFQEVGGLASAFAPGNDSTTATIEFVAAWGNVYSDMTALLRVAKNHRSVPDQFTILEPKYTHGVSDVVPPIVAKYFGVVKLCEALKKLSDHQSGSGELVHFIHRHDAKLAVRLTYSVADLADPPFLESFYTEYVDTSLHVDQKRNIFRSSLLDIFKGQVSITVGELLPKFADLYGVVRDSYSMYAADFSVERMRRELDKLNLDDTLRLNRTLSEIQNQLLALPAALLLAGASISPESTLRTIATLIGIAIFTCLMLVLIANQEHSISAIAKEIDLRNEDFSSQPITIGARYSKAIEKLKRRAARQRYVLRGITVATLVVFFSVLVLASLALGDVTSGV